MRRALVSAPLSSAEQHVPARRLVAKLLEHALRITHHRLGAHAQEANVVTPRLVGSAEGRAPLPIEDGGEHLQAAAAVQRAAALLAREDRLGGEARGVRRAKRRDLLR